MVNAAVGVPVVQQVLVQGQRVDRGEFGQGDDGSCGDGQYGLVSFEAT